MPGAAVRRANPGDVETISRSLARAFEADPVMTWVFPGARLDKLERFFALVTQRHHLGHGEVWMSADGASAALWDPPGRWRMPAGVVLRMARMVGPRGALLLRAYYKSRRVIHAGPTGISRSSGPTRPCKAMAWVLL